MNLYNIFGNFYYYPIQKYTHNIGANFLYLPADSIIRKTFIKEYKDFSESNQNSLLLPKDKIQLQELYRSNNVTDSTISNIYNIEYSQDSINNCNYTFLNALLFKDGFNKISGINVENLKGKKILNVGAGSGELEKFLIIQGCNPKDIIATDVSEQSCKKISVLGISTLVGRLENLNLKQNYFDLIFLSYFIDYDIDQISTFEEVSRILKPSGKIIFEGLLPCRPVLKIEQNKNKFVTKGKSLLGDIKSIVNFFKQNLYKISLEGVYVGHRFIHNRNDIAKLKSCFLVFVKK
ncbi:MAG: class I SAM-dependent methyltransferase [Candidatus Pacebacteria bacterium]|nr:class I SAM-dependent methyltransferase [Candidatus Paceibacterota bacterium]MCF7862932.1 class I SAM-dependent methyltransferase [Candidatus Paceibacterota bacterium]